MDLLIGQDTELFLKHNNSFVSAYGLIPGNKANPYPVKKGAVQVDGMALEINTVPAKTFTQFKTNINTVLSRLQEMIPDNMEMTVCASADFDPKYLDEQPEEAKRMGCDPDYNAYTGEMNIPPEEHPSMRTASGHIHLGWTQNKDIYDPVHVADCCNMAKQLDLYLGIPSLFHDKDIKRREMYGKAGAFRPKHYGLEYRVLSNYWITQEKYMKEVFDFTRKAFNDMEKGVNWNEKLLQENSHFDIEAIINEYDLGAAMSILEFMRLRIVRD